MCKNSLNSNNSKNNANSLNLEKIDLNLIKSENEIFNEIEKTLENVNFRYEDMINLDDSNMKNEPLELLKSNIASIKQFGETKNIFIKSLEEKMNFIHTELNKRNTMIDDLLDSISFKDTEIDNLNQIIIEKDKFNTELKNKIESINQKDMINLENLNSFNEGTNKSNDETKKEVNFSNQTKPIQYSEIKNLRDDFNNEITIITEESKKQINNYKNTIKLLENNLSDFENKNIHLNNTIKTKDLINNNILKENKKLKEYLLEKDEKINKLIDKISILNEMDNENFLKLELNEMKKTNCILNNEIKVLKSSISEKNKLIESLKRG